MNNNKLMTLPTVTRKSEVKVLLEQCLKMYDKRGVSTLVDAVYGVLLSRKVKFPLLEFCACEICEYLPEQEQIPFCDAIQKLKTEGGNVLLGIMLQERLTDHFEQSMAKATEYIADADIWYVCDIIGERVWGVSLLRHPAKTIVVIQRLIKHQSNWVVRSVGAGIHYAIKKGLSAGDVNIVFKLLLQCAGTKDKEIRQGIGWAAKTTARFHPEIINFYESEIANTEKIANWFRSKIAIGLDRHNDATRD